VVQITLAIGQFWGNFHCPIVCRTIRVNNLIRSAWYSIYTCTTLYLLERVVLVITDYHILQFGTSRKLTLKTLKASHVGLADGASLSVHYFLAADQQGEQQSRRASVVLRTDDVVSTAAAEQTDATLYGTVYATEPVESTAHVVILATLRPCVPVP
jgi:hypothetical protein